MKRFTFFILILIQGLVGIAQDSKKVLNYDAFIEQVMKNHPYSYRAEIVKSIGESQVILSKGAVDPNISGNINQKYYDEKQYYSHINGALIIPSWYGISAEAGYSLNDGVYLNSERNTPADGLWYAGLRLELGNGLIINKRKADFEKAKIYKNSSELERSILLNELKRDASISYWKWQKAYQELTIYNQAYNNATIRLNAIKKDAKFGERPFIDTVEASIIVQNWDILLLKSKTYFTNAELNLEMYLWSEGTIPLEINDAIPDTNYNFPSFLSSISLDSLILNHPYLKINELQLQEKKIDLQLKKEQLKPKLTLKYNALSESINGNPLAEYSSANYNWGASFSYPLLTRKERGSVQIAKLKLQDQELKNKMNVTEINYKINSALNNYNLANEQLSIYKQLVTNSQKMYDAEKKLFNLGESSVFMINSRESSWLKSQVELIRIENENKILRSELIYQLMYSN